MARARYVDCEVLYDGKEVGLSSLVESLDYTDNASGKSDEITLNFCGKDADWLRNDFMPEKGSDLDVSFFLNNWKAPGDRLKYHCGNFTIDDITYSGSPGMCVLKGVSIPANEGFQTVPLSKVWQNVTLKQIAQEMMAKYGMKDLYYWGAEPVLETVEQSSQTDSAFLYELCEKQGMFLKVYKGSLVIFDKTVYEPRGITAVFTESDFDGKWEWNSTLNGTYTGAHISYVIPKEKKGKRKKKGDKQEKDNKQQIIDIIVGEGPRILQINEKADSEGEAQRIAKARVNSANEKAVTISFSAMGDPDVVATCNIEVRKMGRCNGKYFVEKVKHRITGTGGYTMSVSGYHIFKRL
ncbi:MAG: hypothetical protein HFG49_08330 [Lachnospiraceae bacterium]|jgi:phage protein D|nr:hypothetical protein [Lachnospiraceae bacterium]